MSRASSHPSLGRLLGSRRSMEWPQCGQVSLVDAPDLGAAAWCGWWGGSGPRALIVEASVHRRVVWMVQGPRQVDDFRPLCGVRRAVQLRTQVEQGDGHLDQPGVTWGHVGIHPGCACPGTRCTPSPLGGPDSCGVVPAKGFPLGVLEGPCVWPLALAFALWGLGLVPLRPRSLPPLAGLSHWVCQTWVQGLPLFLPSPWRWFVGHCCSIHRPREEVVVTELG